MSPDVGWVLDQHHRALKAAEQSQQLAAATYRQARLAVDLSADRAPTLQNIAKAHASTARTNLAIADTWVDWLGGKP